MNEKEIAEELGSIRGFPPQPLLRALKKRILQALALYVPGEASVRVRLHRWRGVRIGSPVHIGTDVLIETAFPEWVSIGNHVSIGIRTIILAHVQELPPKRKEHEGYVSVRIQDDVHIGPGVIILPNVTIGRGAVVTAGSVVTHSVPPLTLVQGNPANSIAECGVPLSRDRSLKEFVSKLRPTGRSSKE